MGGHIFQHIFQCLNDSNTSLKPGTLTLGSYNNVRKTSREVGELSQPQHIFIQLYNASCQSSQTETVYERPQLLNNGWS